MEMDKENFLDLLDTAIEEGKGIEVSVSLPDLPSPEIIRNGKYNVPGKREYYNKAYNDRLELISFPEIYIRNAKIID